VYALAKAQFDLKEYLRAAHTLQARQPGVVCYALSRPSNT
jgi:hypothetical protein